MTMKKLGFCALLIITVCSCDPLRVVQVTNLSNNEIEIVTDFPTKRVIEKDSVGTYQERFIVENDINKIKEQYKNIQIDTVSDNLIIKLQPYQKYFLARRFGGLSKIIPNDLNYSRLSIYTLTDTIIARDKNEIIDLFDNPKTKYIKETDKKYIFTDLKRWRNIVIRE